MDTFQRRERHNAKEDREEIGISEITKHRGLCSTCKNASTCTYPRDPDQPIFYCCEHEGYEECEGSVSLALVRTSNILSRRPGSVVKPLTVDRDSRTARGLCRNCVNRETCTFPKPDGGVWHCDEYE